MYVKTISLNELNLPVAAVLYYQFYARARTRVLNGFEVEPFKYYE